MAYFLHELVYVVRISWGVAVVGVGHAFIVYILVPTSTSLRDVLGECFLCKKSWSYRMCCCWVVLRNVINLPLCAHALIGYFDEMTATIFLQMTQQVVEQTHCGM